jgi:rubrerythrin
VVKKEEPPKKVTPKPEAKKKPAPVTASSMWVCMECGMSFNKSRMSCPTCGGPTQRVSSKITQKDIKSMVFHNRRSRGVPPL